MTTLKLTHLMLAAALAIQLTCTAARGAEAKPGGQPPMIGMYVHQHWAYNHPYAARTWTLDDWRGYLTALQKLGYNTVLIWPVLETMPDPLTASDQENLQKIHDVIDFAHHDLKMRALVVLCPNVAAKNEEATKYKFVERPFFYCDRRVNPGDAVEMGKLMAWRKKLLEPLKEMDGLLIVDGDPGGYPGSNIIEFVTLLKFHRTVLDQLRPGIELYHWIAPGWDAYCRFYATAEFAPGTPEEIDRGIELLAKMNPEPWGLASGRGPKTAEKLGLNDHVMSYQYGGIEGEPTFPMTNFGTAAAYETGHNMGPRGTMGNAQTHCVQLPNTFLFARGAQNKPVTRADYVAFAERLLPGHGETIVAGWESLDTRDAAAKWAALAQLEKLQGQPLATGDLQGLLFGDPQRFVNDLVLMLRAKATLNEFHQAAMGEVTGKPLAEKMTPFVAACSKWQQTHNYKNNWIWPEMEEALMKIDAQVYAPFFAQRSYKGEGKTPFEQVQSGYKKVETFTPRLIEQMSKTAQQLAGQPAS